MLLLGKWVNDVKTTTMSPKQSPMVLQKSVIHPNNFIASNNIIWWLRKCHVIDLEDDLEDDL